MPDISVPWGQGSLEVSLPQHWRLQQVAKPLLRPAPPDWPDRLALSLSRAGTEASLADTLAARHYGRVELVVEDVTRDSPLPEILPIVLREVRHAGLTDDQIEIFFANGMHPPMTDRQVAQKLGESCKGIPWRCNQYENAEAYVFLGQVGGVDVRIDRGVVEADLRIIISSVSPHLQAGFGGGHKMILPGCAQLETIRGLHRLGIGRRARQLVGMDATVNPMRRVIDAAGARLDEYHGRSFAIQYLLDDQNLPAFIATGGILSAHRMMAKQCSAACGVVVPELADVVIANAHPRDFDLWQSFKCIGNTCWAARPNGVIVCLSRCEAQLGGMKVPAWPISPAWTRRAVRWIGPETLSSLLTRLIPGLAGDAAFFVRMAAQTIHRNPVLLVCEALHAADVRFPGIRVFASAQDAIAAAERHLGARPQQVIVFPSGGTTFPVLTAAPAAT